MVRQVIAASGALIALVAFPMAPQAAAADNGSMVSIESGKVQCVVSADDQQRGGGPYVVCQQTNGQPWGTAQYEQQKNAKRLNLVVVRGTGELRWEMGDISTSGEATGQDIVVNAGQSQHVNGWTIQGEDLRTRITYDATGHGILVSVAYVRQF